MIPETFTTTTDTTTSSSSSPADAAVLLQQPFPESILDLDDYRGVTIRFDRAEATATTRRWTNHLDSGNSAATTFRQELQDALTLWRMEGKRGIWMHVPQDMAFVVPPSVELGFSFHSVQDPNVLVLSQWLPTDAPSRLPKGATHQIGVGIVVLSAATSTAAITTAGAASSRDNHHHDDQGDNDNDNHHHTTATTSTATTASPEPKILLVQERTGPAARRKLWKMPTGLLDAGEDIADAALRELKEETGLDGIFDGIICFRHAPQGGAGRTVPDLFFVVRVRLVEQDDNNNTSSDERADSGGQVVKLQADEIADICWMPITEYYQQDIWKTSPAYQQINQAVYESVMMLPNNNNNNSDSSSSSSLLRPHRLLTGYMPGYNVVYDSTK